MTSALKINCTEIALFQAFWLVMEKENPQIWGFSWKKTLYLGGKLAPQAGIEPTTY
jgi:hypothetical protein